MADQEEDFSSLPLTDRFQHKNWKVRKSGYEDAAKAFELTTDEHDPVFRQFIQDSGLWKGAVIDSNVAAQQEGIAALCAFLKFGGRDGCTRTRSHVITSLAEKGLSSTRAATKASSLEAILLFVELDVANPVVEELLPALGNKQPKVIAATLAALTAIVHNYGCKVVDPKPILKILPKAFGHADKNVRAEATNLSVEFYRWLRDAMKPMFWGELKPTQQTDLEAQFEKVKAEAPPKQERLLRSQQEAAARAPPPGADDEEAEEEEPEAEVDVFDLAEPQDVLSKLDPNFYDMLASSKWKERKEALEGLHKILDVPRIKDGDFNEIVRGLAKSMKDANVAVVTNAAQCIEVWAKGLRKPVTKYRSVIMSPIMERLKEKKASVSDALGAALDQVFLATSLTECLEETLEFLKHKNPQVKEGTMKFLVRALRTTRDAPTKPEATAIAEAGKKLLSESSEVLRSGGAEILGTLMKIMSERAMGPHLEGLDDIRKTKIKEFFDVAEVKAKDKPKPVAKPPPPKAAAAPVKKMVKKVPGGAVKKPAPAPSIYAQQAPLEPQPTARAPAKPGLAKPGLKAPLKRTVGGAAPALASPRKAAPQYEDEAPPPAPKLGLGRGLTGRPLGRPAPARPAESPEPMPVPSGLSAAEKAELEELRLDKDRLLRQCDDLRQERSKLNAEVQELRNQNAQLIEDHTRDMLSVKAKETQLVRARSEAEASEAMCAQLKREMERLKRALTTAERVGGGGGISSPSRDSHRQFSAQGMNGDGTDEAAMYRDTGMYGATEGRRTPGYGASRPSYSNHSSNGLDDNNNGNGNGYGGDARHRIRSPDLMLNRDRDASGSGGRSPAREPSRAYRSERSGMSSLSQSGSGAGSGREDGAGGAPVESWKRAAEVTSALKAKIEQMKARQGISRP